MSDTHANEPAAPRCAAHAPARPTGWVGWIIFAGVTMTDAMVARVLGIAFAVISAIVNLAFIAAYPVWAVIIIALDVLVISALAVHGREMKYV
jgi:mannose/fructose/N-acetylgalactosamine-specific phosphotransferase system component IIC